MRLIKLCVTIIISSSVLMHFTSRAHASDPILLSRPLTTRDYVVEDPQNLGEMKIPIYRGSINYEYGVAPQEHRFYYAPFITLIRVPGAEKLMYYLHPHPTTPEKKLVAIPLRWDREDLKKIIQKFLINEALCEPHPSIAQIQPLPLEDLSFSTGPGYPIRIKFNTLQVTERTEPSFTITSEPLSETDAQRFIDDLQEGIAYLQANFVFNGASYQENTFSVTIKDIESTDAYKDLTGTANAIVTRNQVSRISQEALRSISIKDGIEFEDEDFGKLTDRLMDYLLSKHDTSLSGWKDLANKFKELGFSPLDFRSDLIEKSRLRQNTLMHDIFVENLRNTQKDNDKDFNLFTNFDDILDVNYKDKDKYRDYVRSIYKEALKVKDVETEFEGTRFIPKSIKIFRNDFSKLKSTGKIDLKSSRFTATKGGATILISKNTICNEKGTPSVEERLSEIRNGMNPIGTIVAYGGTGKPPYRWEFCNGRPVNRVGRYAALFEAIGTGWGEGDGESTFNLPDLTDKFIVGVSNKTRIGQSGGKNSVTVDTTKDIDLVLKQASSGKLFQVRVGGNDGSVREGSDFPPSLARQYNFSTGKTVIIDNRPEFRRVNFIIRVE